MLVGSGIVRPPFVKAQTPIVPRCTAVAFFACVFGNASQDRCPSAMERIENHRRFYQLLLGWELFGFVLARESCTHATWTGWTHHGTGSYSLRLVFPGCWRLGIGMLQQCKEDPPKHPRPTFPVTRLGHNVTRSTGLLHPEERVFAKTKGEIQCCTIH
jgi:hypothetical protein